MCEMKCNYEIEMEEEEIGCERKLRIDITTDFIFHTWLHGFFVELSPFGPAPIRSAYFCTLLCRRRHATGRWPITKTIGRVVWPPMVSSLKVNQWGVGRMQRMSQRENSK